MLRTIAGNRSPDSYIAGAAALNRDGPRFSGDIDIFQDGDERLVAIADADAALLAGSGLKLTWTTLRGPGFRRALVEGLGDKTVIEWAADSDFRFFPTVADEMFGYVLHPVDLATNKASAAADRREPRDIVDLVAIHQRILPLGAVVWAAIGRFPGPTPEEMLAQIVRHSRFTAEEFRVLATEQPIDVADMHRRIRTMLEDAERFISHMPSDAVGVIFLEDGRPVQPEPDALERYHRHAGTRRGHWPSSSEIGHAMLERYGKDRPDSGGVGD
ncbi:MAG TPA: nucleotidyl transferase AbiEii/AbiGii toxin family protein [Vineibacter sp.]|nr:nucleotidyl transferase AbiEii/AbiGii toxin family protein [Vineibacter sp.]